MCICMYMYVCVCVCVLLAMNLTDLGGWMNAPSPLKGEERGRSAGGPCVCGKPSISMGEQGTQRDREGGEGAGEGWTLHTFDLT